VGNQVRGLQGTQVPDQLIAHVVLDVGHSVGERATVEGITALRSDVAPDLGEYGSCGFSFAMLAQLYAPADSGHDGIWFDHCASLKVWMATVAATTDTCFPPKRVKAQAHRQEAAAALSQPPSLQTLAAAGIQPNVAMMQTAGLAAKLSARYEVPSIARVAVDLAPQLRGIDIMNAAGIASSLDAALATFRPQRVMFDAIINAGLGRHNAAFAAQAAQILSSQESISRLVASSGSSAAMAGLFATMGR
jgi:hypothetical protein